MITLFWAVIEDEWKPIVGIKLDSLECTELRPGDKILLDQDGKILRATLISDFFKFDSRYREMLMRHYGFPTLPFLAGTYTYNESYFLTR